MFNIVVVDLWHKLIKRAFQRENRNTVSMFKVRDVLSTDHEHANEVCSCGTIVAYLN